MALVILDLDFEVVAGVMLSRHETAFDCACCTEIGPISVDLSEAVRASAVPIN